MKDFYYELVSEDESGSNKIDYVLDDVLVEAVGNGAEGIEEVVYRHGPDDF